MMRSLHLRLLLVSLPLLAISLGLVALALDQAFRDSLDEAMREKLQGYVYALLAAADEDATGRMRLPAQLPDPRFSNPDSGLYAEVVGEQGSYHWRSFSLIGKKLELLRAAAPGERRFRHLDAGNGEPLYLIDYGVAWEDDQGRTLDYTLTVGEDRRGLADQVATFRSRLFYWLGGVALLLLFTQGVVVAWGLRPLRRVAADLRHVESGQIDTIEGDYPRELQGLVRNLNGMIRSGQASRDRYRNSLGDLAHSLKTPLTLLQGAVESGDGQLREMVRDQVQRMDQIIGYQLRRAATAEYAGQGTAVAILPQVKRLATTLEKVYRDKHIHCRLGIDPDHRFFGDEADLLEFMGNLMENAFKYGRQQVRVSTRETDRELLLTVEDDGPGIPAEQRQDVLDRGVRADSRVPGQGIGLSVAREIIGLYGGNLSIGESELGGAMIRIHLPVK